MSTIKDVARLAGVSTTTVSNIINQKGSIGDKKYKRVMEVIEELNFKPNFLASNLRNNKTKFIAVVLPNLNSHYSQIFQGIQEVLDSKGFSIILKLTGDSKYTEDKILKELVVLGISGALLVTADSSNLERFNGLISKSIPVVFLERGIPNEDYTSVVFDNENIVHQATIEILNEKKASAESCDKPAKFEIALITGPAEFSSEEESKRGFVSACGSFGLNAEKIYSAPLNRQESFYSIMNIIHGLSSMPDCFFATNQDIAENLLEALAVLGYSREVYLLCGSGWHKYHKDSKVNKIYRDALKLGQTGSRQLLEYINSTLLFENSRIVIKNDGMKPERSIFRPVSNKVSVLMLESPTTDALFKLVNNFTNRSGIKIEYEKLSYANLYQKIIDENNKKSGTYDVFMIDYPWFYKLCNDSFLLKLDSHIKNDNDGFLSNFLNTVKRDFIDYNRNIYALPFMVTVQFLFYRKDLIENPGLKRKFFRQYGIELRTPRTWTEFELVAEFFTKSFNPDSPVKYGTSILGLEPTGIMDEYLPRQWSYKGRIVSSKGDISINSVENKRALTSLCNAYKYSPEESINNWWDDQIKMFLKNELSMLLTFATHIPWHKNELFEVDRSNIGICSVPGNCPMLGGWSLALNKYSNLPDEGYSFIKWASGDGIAVHNTLLGGLPPKKCVADNTELQAFYPWLKNITENLALGRKRELVKNKKGRYIDPYVFENVISDEIFKVLKKEASVEEALDGMKASCARIIKG